MAAIRQEMTTIGVILASNSVEPFLLTAENPPAGMVSEIVRISAELLLVKIAAMVNKEEEK